MVEENVSKTFKFTFNEYKGVKNFPVEVTFIFGKADEKYFRFVDNNWVYFNPVKFIIKTNIPLNLNIRKYKEAVNVKQSNPDRKSAVLETRIIKPWFGSYTFSPNGWYPYKTIEIAVKQYGYKDDNTAISGQMPEAVE